MTDSKVKATAEMQKLLAIGMDDRDLKWELSFLQTLPQVSCRLLSQDPQVGPDNWPYMLIDLDTQAADAVTEPVGRLLEWLSTRGIGLVVNPQKDYPDYVLTFGMIWSYQLRGKFLDLSAGGSNIGVADQVVQPQPPVASEYEVGSQVVRGPPTKEALPDTVRKILKEFFRDQGVHKPKIMGLSPDGKSFELAVSLESIGNPKEEEYQGIAEAISWFLPPDYPVVLMSESQSKDFLEL